MEHPIYLGILATQRTLFLKNSIYLFIFYQNKFKGLKLETTTHYISLFGCHIPPSSPIPLPSTVSYSVNSFGIFMSLPISFLASFLQEGYCGVGFSYYRAD